MRVRSTLIVCLGFAAVAASAAPSFAEQSIALVLDASGSMVSRLPEGRTRIEAAKAAVGEIVGKLPPDVQLSLRAYGHQSPAVKHDCRDTELLVGFDRLANNKATILAKTRDIEAQGYTPITYVLKLAAEDVGKESAKPRIVILVSDGKETCEGDPCATAKALADADASLVVHTIGFAVDTAAQFQLQCIARVARGRYFDADGTGKLAAALGEAAKPAPPPPPPQQQTTQIVITAPKPGKLLIRNAEMSGHKVSKAESGEVVKTLNSSGPSAELPAGFYNVTFGKSVWKSVEVQPGETTVLEPGVIEIRTPSISGHKVLDNETSEEIGSIVSVEPGTERAALDFCRHLRQGAVEGHRGQGRRAQSAHPRRHPDRRRRDEPARARRGRHANRHDLQQLAARPAAAGQLRRRGRGTEGASDTGAGADR